MNVNLDAKYELYINGQWVAPSGGKYFTTTNPATGEKLAECAEATKEDVDAAVQAAWAAFPAWRDLEPDKRAAILLKIADIIDENKELLATIESMDNGKPIRETMTIDVPYSSDHFRYFAGAIRTEEGSASILKDHVGEFMNIILHEPIGVVGQIVPWNFPFLMAAWKLAPVLASGCCTVFKPSSTTSLSVLTLVKLIGHLLPPGVLNVVTGGGSRAGQYMLDHPGFRKLAFTGSTEVGLDVAKAAADKLIPSTLELGGKSANIFFEDCDWDRALDGLQLGILFNQGQVCCAGSRVFVQESIYDKFVDAAVKAFNNITVGDPLDPNTQMGSQVDQGQLRKIMSYVELQGRRLRQRCLHEAHPHRQRQQQHAGGPGRDLWPRGCGHQVQDRGRGHRHGQRLRLRSGRRRLDPGHQPCPPGGPRRGDRPYVGQHLQHDPCRRPLRRLQAVRHRP